MKCANVLFAFGILCCVVLRSQAVTIETVPIGNPDNAPDTEVMTDGTSGYGAVGYAFRIGKYEVTAGQYTEFLNAVAQNDTYGLYSGAMDYDLNPANYGSNIKRMGDPGSYAYNVAPDWADRPVNWVSFWDAARFVNWLHNGQPTGPQSSATTEDGAYELNGYTGSDGHSITRQPDAKYWIPSVDEWYKAAYHDQSAGLGAIYFDYPTGSNSTPGHDVTETTNAGNNANYALDLFGNYTIGSPYYRTEAGEFELSDSPYGTFDQGGNLYEWNESLKFDVPESARILPGGAAHWTSGNLHASNSRFNYARPNNERYDWGFRVASIAIPEPGTLLLFSLAAAGMMVRRGRILRIA